MSVNKPNTYYINFEAAAQKLAEFARLNDGSEIHRAGLIQAFKLTFEQCWKALQKIAGNQGVTDIASPKKAFECAIAAQMIPAADEPAWIAMLTERNLTTHTYREKMARDISDSVLSKHLPLLSGLLARMKIAE